MIRIKPFQDFDVEWTRQAACRGERDGFYPVLNEQFEDEWSDEAKGRAKAICSGCPVKLTCLDYAVTGREDHGIWGETLPDERRRLRLKWARTLSSLMRGYGQEIREVADKYVMSGGFS